MKLSILFIVINGAGLGHLTRALAVAIRLQNINSELEIIFCTTSNLAPIVNKLGFSCYYPTTSNDISENSMDGMGEYEVLQQLETIMELHHPRVVIFDGAYPISAVLSPLMESKSTKTLWIKREGDRSHMIALNVYEKFFDHILVPKEVGLEYKASVGHKQYTPPIIFLDQAQGYERQQVRSKLKLNEDDRLWYVQLGNDETDNKKQDINFIINQLLESKNLVILFGDSILNPIQQPTHERVITLNHYPNSIYFTGVDFAVSAAGYNTFHELLSFQVPTIFLPNKRVVKDDQVARARRAQALGMGIVLNHSWEFADAYKKMVEEEQEYRDNLGRISIENGALQVAEFIIQLL